MRHNISGYTRQQVFLNYPYDDDFVPYANALTFGIVASGLLPLSARDLSAPDTIRLTTLVEAIGSCRYSAHDLSRTQGEGPSNLARMNMPLEMGMAFYHALSTQFVAHRCAFFVPTPHVYQAAGSDLAGLDPKCYNADPIQLLTLVYEWLRDVVPVAHFSSQPTMQVVDAFVEFEQMHKKLAVVVHKQPPSYAETREVMQRVCEAREWWDWRKTRAGRDEFGEIPLHWIDNPGSYRGSKDTVAASD